MDINQLELPKAYHEALTQNGIQTTHDLLDRSPHDLGLGDIALRMLRHRLHSIDPKVANEWDSGPDPDEFEMGVKILTQFADGLSASEIARPLGISPYKARAHTQRFIGLLAELEENYNLIPKYFTHNNIHLYRRNPHALAKRVREIREVLEYQT